MLATTAFGTDKIVTADEVRGFLGLPPLAASNPQHTHNVFAQAESRIDRLSHTHSHGMRFDSSLFYTGVVDTMKTDMRRMLDAEITRSLVGKKDTSLKNLVGIQHDGDILRLTPIKENSMPQSKLRTPSENIARKDLIVALAISDGRGEDEILHGVALVQDLDEGQSITRGWQVKEGDILNRHIQIVDGPFGLVTDYKDRDFTRNDTDQLVVDGKLVSLSRQAYIIIEPANYRSNDNSSVFIQNINMPDGLQPDMAQDPSRQ